MNDKAITQDKYTQAFLMIIFGVLLFLVLRDKMYRFGALALGASGFGYLGYILSSPGRILEIEPGSGTTAEDGSSLVQIRVEDGCGFEPFALDKLNLVDGIRIADKTFKVGDGVSVYIDEKGNIKERGPGSYVVNRMGGGGYLRKMPDVCWE